MSMGMTSIIAKPSPFNANHVVNSATSRTTIYFFTSGSFNPLEGVDRKYGSCHFNLSSKKREQRIRDMAVSCSSQPVPPPAAPSSPFPGLPGRKGWIAGIVLSFVLPFMANKWGPLLFLKKELDTTLERVEETVEVMEKVAEGVEHLAEEIEKDLPDGALKDTVVKLEQAALKAEKSAELVDETIHKVEKLEEKLESRVESELAKAKQANGSKKSQHS